MQAHETKGRPAAVRQAPTPKEPPVKPSFKLPFFFVDRSHLTQRLGAWFSSLRQTLVRNRAALTPLAVSLLVIYVLGAVVFWGRFLPGTRVDGVSASFKTPAAVAAEAQGKADAFSLSVSGQGVDLSLTGEDVGLTFDEAAFAKGAAQHTPGLSWPIALLTSRDLAVSEGVGYDEEHLRALVSEAVGHANEGATPTTSATVAYQKETDSFAVAKEQWGTMIDPKAAEASVMKAVSTLQNVLELDRRVLAKPTLYASDSRMTKAVEQADARKDLSLDLTVWGNVVRTVSAEELRGWFALDDSCNVTGDLEALTEWAQGPLSKELDTAGAKRAYTRPDDGKYVEVEGGTYGWIVDGAALAQLVSDRIAKGSNEPIEVPMRSEGTVYAPGEQDWGGRFLDVDLTEQYARFFDGGANVIWESECVSGDPGVGNDTVTGVYAIYDKESPKKLIGTDEDEDGEPDYESDVQFWMPFYGGYGLHDATWRSYFGPDAYLYGGSHGCVNLPLYAAQELYALIQIDDVVVVHY